MCLQVKASTGLITFAPALREAPQLLDPQVEVSRWVPATMLGLRVLLRWSRRFRRCRGRRRRSRIISRSVFSRATFTWISLSDRRITRKGCMRRQHVGRFSAGGKQDVFEL